jgi:hypothetical protein
MSDGEQERATELAALMAQRAELDKQHEAACLELEAQGPAKARANYKRCVAVYDEREALQRRIDAHLAAGRAK